MPKELIDQILKLNEENSVIYTSPDEYAARHFYRSEHPTEFAAFKCMDGRVNVSLLAKLPMGIVKPFRNIGGSFEIGWPAFATEVVDFVNYSIQRGRKNIFLATYHFSIGDTHRGCRGHNYDTGTAIASARDLVKQFERVFGAKHQQVYPIVMGIETDSGSLVLHDGAGHRSQVLGDLVDTNSGFLRRLIMSFYPDMHERMVDDLLPLLVGNVAYVSELRKTGRPPVDLEHKERVLAIGRGFPWLHTENLALIVNDMDPRLDKIIAAAAGILVGNRDAGRIPDTGAVLFASVAYRKHGFERKAAVERARYLTRLGLQSIREHYPALEGFFTPLTTVVDGHTWKLERVDN
jgi:hypothetical protein